MYPSYKVRDVLNEYAITYYAMLNEGYRQRYEHYNMLATIASIPIMRVEAINELMKQLEWATKDPSDILSSSGDSDGIADLKKMLGKI